MKPLRLASLCCLSMLIAAGAAAQTPAHVIAAPAAPARQSPDAHEGAKPPPGRKPAQTRSHTKAAAKGEKQGAKHAAKTAQPQSKAQDAAAEPPKPAAPARPAPPPPDPTKGSVTGLPIPRFAALRADEVNMRTGPGTRYPIEWVFKRRGLPVEIEREFDVWRLVQTPDGTKGWVHEATLVGRRDFMVTGADRTMRDAAEDTARAVAILKPGVVGRVKSCAAGSDWCRVQVGDYKGWLKRSEVWGVPAGEAIAG